MSCENNTESGKVFVKGKAAGKYTCDIVAIKITFYCANSSAAKATETMMSQCEKFLQYLAEYGVDISTIQLHYLVKPSNKASIALVEKVGGQLQPPDSEVERILLRTYLIHST